jgi:hypothetical protein
MSQRTKQTQPNPKRKKPNSASHRAIEPPSQQRLTRNPMQPGKGSGLPDRPGRRPMWKDALFCTVYCGHVQLELQETSAVNAVNAGKRPSPLALGNRQTTLQSMGMASRPEAHRGPKPETGNLNRQDTHPAALCTSCPFVTTSGMQCASLSAERLAGCRVTRALG